MPENNVVSSSSDADKLQESMRNLKIEEDKHGSSEAAHANHKTTSSIPQVLLQDRPGVPDCIYFLKHGMCGYGTNCRYNHPSYTGQEHLSQGDLPERVGQPDCQHFLRTGTCKYGYTCKYNHPKNGPDDGQMSLNVFGLPMRREENSCPHYMRTGYCKFGITCKFNHPQPATFEAAPPVSGSSAYAPVGSSMVSPSGMPFIGGIPSWFQRPDMSSPQINGFPSYLPFVLPSSQGLMPGQHGWSTYTGAVSPTLSSDTHGPSQMANSNHVQFHSSTPVLFPERPDQPDCQYYMKNGSCKYGSTCKYHHPKDRITSSTACIIGPLGLPLRPGQAVCTFYSSNGSCKYGLGCKYDHPLAGYYNYAVPAVSVSDPSVLFPYQRSSQVTWTPPDSAHSKTLKLTDGVTKSEAANNNAERNASFSENARPQASSRQSTSSGTLIDQSD